MSEWVILEPVMPDQTGLVVIEIDGCTQLAFYDRTNNQFCSVTLSVGENPAIFNIANIKRWKKAEIVNDLVE
jgi:hypothetical protein